MLIGLLLFFLGVFLSVLESIAFVWSILLVNIFVELIRQGASDFESAFTRVEALFHLGEFGFRKYFELVPLKTEYALFLYFILLWILRSIHGVMWGDLAERYVWRTRFRQASRILKHPPSGDELRTRLLLLGAETSETGFTFLHIFQTSLSEILKMIGAFCLSYSLAPSQIWIGGLLCCLGLVSLRVLTPSLSRQASRVQTQNVSMWGRIWRLIRAWETMWTYKKINDEMDKLKKSMTYWIAAVQKMHFKKSLLSPFVEMVILLFLMGVLALVWFSPHLASLSKELWLNQFALFLFFVLSLKTLSNSLSQAQRGWAVRKRLKAQYEARPYPLPWPHVSYRDDQLSFSVSPGMELKIQSDRVCIQGEICYLKSGSLVLIQGPSGSGKTTFIKRLARALLLEVGGRSFVFSSQEPWIYEGSAQLTLTYPFVEVNSEELLKHPDFRLPRHWEDAQKWSRGEKQRLMFLRHLFLKRPIWIFDEITASLDEESARIIKKTLLSQNSWKFCFLVSHDPDFQSLADLVLSYRE